MHNSPAKNSTSFQNSTSLTTRQAAHITPSLMEKPKKLCKLSKVSCVSPLLRKVTSMLSELLEFRNTPTNKILGSPTQRLMGRCTRTLLPTTQKLLIPKTIPPSQVQSELCSQKSIQKRHYDKSTNKLKHSFH